MERSEFELALRRDAALSRARAADELFDAIERLRSSLRRGLVLNVVHSWYRLFGELYMPEGFPTRDVMIALSTISLPGRGRLGAPAGTFSSRPVVEVRGL